MALGCSLLISQMGGTVMNFDGTLCSMEKFWMHGLCTIDFGAVVGRGTFGSVMRQTRIEPFVRRITSTTDSLSFLAIRVLTISISKTEASV